MKKATMSATALVRRLNRAEELLSGPTRKTKASVSISQNLLDAAAIISKANGRSALFERALRRYVRSSIRAMRDAHDLAVINANASRSNRESDDLLEIQSWPD